MKRTCFIFLFLIFSLSVHCQRIYKSRYDKHLKQYIILTSSETLQLKFSTVLGISIRSQDSVFYLNFTGSGYPMGNIDISHAVILYLADSTTISVQSKGSQEARLAPSGSWEFSYEYFVSYEQIERLSVAEVKSIRFYSRNFYIDIELNKKRIGKINKLCALFLRKFSESRKG